MDGLLACWLIGLAGWVWTGQMLFYGLQLLGWNAPRDFDWDFDDYTAYGVMVLLWPLFVPAAIAEWSRQ